MKGNVTCSCGHSWSKSKSSKKDMNICHICGKDNTMKDGGWLEKYNDGGELNYNDSNASAGPGFEGDGYSNVGRNYSPAWGGQFKDGGEIPQFKPGGKTKKKPIIVNDKNDPRLKAYQDSLQAYNANERDFKGYTPLTKEILHKEGADYPGNSYSQYIGNPNYVTKPYGHGSEHSFVWKPDVRKPTQPIMYRPEPTPQSTIDFMEGNYGQEPITEIPQASAYGEVVDPRTGYTHMTRQGSPMYPIVGQNVPEMAMGGSMPGSVGFMYARTNDPAPSNGKYAKKTMASAENGAEMKYYQEGLDFQPKSISRNGSVIKDDMGQWAYPGEITEIGSNQITMQGVDYPVLGISDTGDTQMMYPNEDYTYEGSSVTEYPMAQNGETVAYADNTRLGAVPRYSRPSYVQPQEFGLLQAGDVATDIMQLGHFLPHPIPQAIAYAGDFFGAGIDGYQAIEEAAKGNYRDAGINAASAFLPGYLKSAGYLRSAANATPGSIAERIAKLGLGAGNYRPLTALPRLANNPVIKKAINANKAVAGALGAETIYDAQSNKKKRQGGQLTKLDQLTNFTNYNTKQPGGWLDKYQ